MNKIYNKKWKKFKLGDLFNLINSKAYHTKDVEETDLGLHYITRSKFNNGLKSYVVKKNDYQINPAGTISFGAENANFFYQENDYITGNKMYYIDTRKISKYSALFLRSVLEQTFTNNFSFSDGMIPDRIKDEYISLPQDSNQKPDWEYMESYMKNIMEKSQQNISKLKSIDTDKNKINIINWKKFHLYDKGLFIIDMGTKLDKSKMTVDKPCVNFVGRANTNNGITISVDKIPDLKPYQAGNMTLSLGGEYLGSCFIQSEEFYTSQNVVVLIPQWNMPNEVKNFISTMIFKESRTHYKAFVDELNRHIKTDFSFYLPVDSNNEPDWEYMGNYIKNIMANCESKLENLKLYI